MPKTQQSRKKRSPSSLLLTLRERFQRSWTSWRLKRARKKLLKEQKRLQKMQVLMDYQHLKLKELTLREQTLKNQQEEQQEILQFRLQGALKQQMTKSELDSLLGL